MTLAAAILSSASSRDPVWFDVGAVEDIPFRGARRLRRPDGDIALFRTGDGKIFALEDRCPHKAGPLSDGIVSGHAVACPLHSWMIDLRSGKPLGADAGKGCTPVVPVLVEAGRVFIPARG